MFGKRRTPGSLSPRDLDPLLKQLRNANAATSRVYTAERADRQPVHTVYGGAHIFRANSAQRLGALALAALEEHAPDAATFAEALQLDAEWGRADDLAETVRARVVEKLLREPVEDYRLDFEDGYGVRSDEEEDGHAQSAAQEVAAGLRAGTLPPFIGIRIKPMSPELHGRSLRTLDIFLTSLVRDAQRQLPPGFVVTIPKIMSPGHVSTVANACTALERRLGLRSGALQIELMVETPQSIIAADGTAALRGLVAAGDGRVIGAHFGAYDYTALCGITAAWQHMRHPVCDFARHIMQVSLAQSGVRLSDGATNIMPIAPHRPAPDRPLTDEQRRENRETVHRAWKIHFDDVRHSLMNGYYQGWDLHPAQLPSRYAAVYTFFLSACATATARLRNFVEKAAQATLVGECFDDGATGEGLLNFFLRGLTTGALTMDEARETGLTIEELQSRSFQKVIENRRHFSSALMVAQPSSPRR
jgi:citrate lyase beta subunit